MNSIEKINFLLKVCQKEGQSFPHTLMITEDFSMCEAFASDISSKLQRDLVIVNAAMLYKIGDLCGVVTKLKPNDFLLIEDIDLLNEECLYCFVGILENFRASLRIETRNVEVKLNEFTIICTVAKLHLMPRKLVSSFFCILAGAEIRRISVEAIHRILNDGSIATPKEVAEYIFSIADSMKIEIKPFLINIRKFLSLSGLKKNYVLTCNVVDEYFNFLGISEFKIKDEVGSSRQISVDVQREVWRRDQGKCVVCQSQERLEYDHIIPFSKGGSNTVRNIQLLCESCNREKSSKI